MNRLFLIGIFCRIAFFTIESDLVHIIYGWQWFVGMYVSHVSNKYVGNLTD